MRAFMEDLFAVLVLVGILMFAIIRWRNNPTKGGRDSRFFGSHTSGAWLVLFMIFMVVATLVFYRGAKINAEGPEGMDGAFASHAMAAVLEPLGETANEWMLTLGLWAHVAVILGFLLIVLHSKLPLLNLRHLPQLLKHMAAKLKAS